MTTRTCHRGRGRLASGALCRSSPGVCGTEGSMRLRSPAGRPRGRRLSCPRRRPPSCIDGAAAWWRKAATVLFGSGAEGSVARAARQRGAESGGRPPAGLQADRDECGSGEQRLVWRRRESLWGRRLSLSCQCVGSLGYLCAMRGPRPGCGRLGRPRLRRSPRRWPAVLALESEDLAPCESEDVRSDVGMPIWMKEARAETVEKRERPTVAASTSKRRVWERSRKIDILFHGQRPNITTIVIAASH